MVTGYRNGDLGLTQGGGDLVQQQPGGEDVGVGELSEGGHQGDDQIQAVWGEGGEHGGESTGPETLVVPIAFVFALSTCSVSLLLLFQRTLKDSLSSPMATSSTQNSETVVMCSAIRVGWVLVNIASWDCRALHLDRVCNKGRKQEGKGTGDMRGLRYPSTCMPLPKQ